MYVKRFAILLFIALLAAGLFGAFQSWGLATSTQRAALGVYGAGIGLLLFSVATDVYLSCLPYPLLVAGAWMARGVAIGGAGDWQPAAWVTPALFVLWPIALAGLLLVARAPGDLRGEVGTRDASG